MTTAAQPTTSLRVHKIDAAQALPPAWEAFVAARAPIPLSFSPEWLRILARGLRHEPYMIEATEGDRVVGLLPLAFVKSLLFGRFLVGLPYLNYGGVLADDPAIATLLIDQGLELADKLRVKRFELRHVPEQVVDHPRLATRTGHKVHMRLALETTPEAQWKALASSVRNQVRKGQKQGLSVAWGRHELLPGFYDVFSRNMRDLGTPVYSRELFAATLDAFPDRAELCVVTHDADRRPIAAAILLHGWGITEVPSASSLRAYNKTNANMLMYWHLLQRAIERGQPTFDFGRSTPDGPTFRFKEQWGAVPFDATWQSLDNGSHSPGPDRADWKYQALIGGWRRLPLCFANVLGPGVVKGIP